jgi:hypothetical protein
MQKRRSDRRDYYPSTQRLVRHQQMITARSYLRGYLGAVRDALRDAGFPVVRGQITTRTGLDASLTVALSRTYGGRQTGEEVSEYNGSRESFRVGFEAGALGDTLSAGSAGDGAVPENAAEVAPVVELAWAEDTGWSVAHHLLGDTPTPWRYLHQRLVPDPVTVAIFLESVLTMVDEVGMPYPAQFRYRAQPLQPVLDELARYCERESPLANTYRPPVVSPEPRPDPPGVPL